MTAPCPYYTDSKNIKISSDSDILACFMKMTSFVLSFSQSPRLSPLIMIYKGMTAPCPSSNDSKNIKISSQLEWEVKPSLVHYTKEISKYTKENFESDYFETLICRTYYKVV